MSSPSPELLLAGILALSPAVLLLLRRPEVGLHISLLLLYLNVPAIAVRVHGFPKPLAAATTIAFMLPAFLKNTTSSAPRVVLDVPFLLMLLFLASATTSCFAVEEPSFAAVWMSDYFTEGILLYFLVANVVRSLPILRRATWVLLIAGAFLSSLTIFQELTHSYTNTFGGFAQRALVGEKPQYMIPLESNRLQPEVRTSRRASGPVDDPNYYAQILIVLLPLGWARFRGERSRLKRLAAGLCVLIILGGTGLTYSRGGFVAIVIMLTLMAVLRAVTIRQALAGGLLFFLAVLLVAPGYSSRLLTIRAIQGIVDPASRQEPDAAARGRTAEMLAAWNVFRDHPIFGVGPGQFSKVHSVNYLSESYGLKRIAVPRRGHSLYFELAAETGVVGAIILLAIVGVVLYRVRRAWLQWRDHDDAIACLPAAFLFGIAGYLATGIFLQLAFQRYYWLYLALAAATARLTCTYQPVDARKTIIEQRATYRPQS